MQHVRNFKRTNLKETTELFIVRARHTHRETAPPVCSSLPQLLLFSFFMLNLSSCPLADNVYPLFKTDRDTDKQTQANSAFFCFLNQLTFQK